MDCDRNSSIQCAQKNMHAHSESLFTENRMSRNVTVYVASKTMQLICLLNTYQNIVYLLFPVLNYINSHQEWAATVHTYVAVAQRCCIYSY